MLDGLYSLAYAAQAANRPLLQRAILWAAHKYEAMKSVVLQVLGFQTLSTAATGANAPLTARAMLWAKNAVSAIKSAASQVLSFFGITAATELNTWANIKNTIATKAYIFWEGVKKAATKISTWWIGASTTATITSTLKTWLDIAATKAQIFWEGIKKAATVLSTWWTGALTTATIASTSATWLNIAATKAQIFWEGVRRVALKVSAWWTGAATVATVAATGATGAATAATVAATGATGAATAATVAQTGALARFLPWLAHGVGYLAGYAWGLAGVVAGSAAFAAALTVVGVAVAATALAFGMYQIGKWLSGFILSDEDVTKNHENFLKVSEELKQNKKEIDDIASKKIAALDMEGKKRAENLQLWGLNHTQASIGAKDAASELKMLESMAKAGNKNVDMLARLNELKEESTQIQPQESQAQEVSAETKNQIDEIPGIKTKGPITQNSVGQMNENTKENNVRLGEVVDLLSKVVNNKKISELLEHYLPDIAENKGEGSLANVANGWI
jgi:hypothetical protein